MTRTGSIEILPGLIVSRETEKRLRAFCDLVEKWTSHINLVSRASLHDIWFRHIIDSAQILTHIEGTVEHWVDAGSGAGFPGLVIGLIAQETDRIDQLTLLESDGRKATFLQTAARELGLSVEVKTTRVEQCVPLTASIFTARALGPLTDLLGHASRHLSPTGTAYLPKGKTFETEIQAAFRKWKFECTAFQSATDASARILKIKNISHV